MNKKELILKKTNMISLIALLGAVVYWSVALVVLFCFEEWLSSWWTSSMSFIGAGILLMVLWFTFCIGWLTYNIRKIKRGPEKVDVVDLNGFC